MLWLMGNSCRKHSFGSSFGSATPPLPNVSDLQIQGQVFIVLHPNSATDNPNILAVNRFKKSPVISYTAGHELCEKIESRNTRSRCTATV